MSSDKLVALQRAQRIELRTRKLVNSSFAGAYHSVFKGRGIAFDTVRPYQAGDDIRDIDWKVTARANEPYIKRYVEERELTVMLVLDGSASCLFGSVSQQKRELAAELCAVIALSAISNNDKVGALIFSDKVEKYIAPRKGRKHVLRLIYDLLEFQAEQSGTDLTLALQATNRLLKQRSIVFLVSDFLVDNTHYAREISALARRHDVIAALVSDPLENAWPEVGLVVAQDAETGQQRWIDTASAAERERFAAQSAERLAERERVFSTAQIDWIELVTGADYLQLLTDFFQRRIRRAR